MIVEVEYNNVTGYTDNRAVSVPSVHDLMLYIVSLIVALIVAKYYY